ncbi:hypothetical protein H6G20_23540 [Desertifilum sp. FACHB-1129]|uniref:Uncharacterized protein n=2 Tax=Desertifilum tharense IPPAS B-1220 TaxID=1781255 RepID=A0A1E5QJ42_9CYAN|nr:MULTISPECIES: hypothetical protein [Desertifilum]MDA0212515.1 hypothetical protein [Cyanobacteria bacterium FC1]MBD2314646.1 hypothetical protein [Desertifilum sp. FACHB-1129]MBD2324935.1 hypothetical protein [Desertifilum sp. FACHB-866]MBD2335074.1 hypothetical protein [Desertifilum sp. FACHB-868]OEJ74638.1 hypothetical protein BH720_13785 [Desertifilum tharense IPPAS B-1220]
MAFSQYKDIALVLQEFQITYTEENFMGEAELRISEYFREDLQTILQDGVPTASEFSICENLIYPILKEVWKLYRSNFVLWGHRSLICDENLSGFPEYILARRSPLGKIVFDKPYFLLVEAKQDKFEEGWAQCLAEMVAAQRLNDETQVIIFGIVSNGNLWQFGKLESNLFTRNQTFYTLQDLDRLFAAVNYIFQQCEAQLNRLAIA